MGKKSRFKPVRLAQKLKEIRIALNLSQDGMLEKLGLTTVEGYERSVISAFELGKREPSLDVLLAYGTVANIYVDVLIDDNLDLPAELPSRTKSGGALSFL